MQVPAWTRPGSWGVVAGAVAMTIVGFWGLGWVTGGSAERLAQERTETAVVAALVPFCVAKAQQDAEQAKLTKLYTETSGYGRTRLVSDAGWATPLGLSSPDTNLARACSDKLMAIKAA
jgi:hypothetical protein